jgi:hypothetical protein
MRRRGEWRARYEQARSDQRTLQQITFHESAHALCAYILGCTVEKICCGRGAFGDSDSLSGACHWNHASGDGRNIDPKTKLIVSLAAPAIDHFLGNRLNASGDQNDARRAAEQISSTDADAVLEHGRREAETLVGQHVTAISALAGALMRAQHHELDGKEVEQILARAGVHRRGPQLGFERRGGVDRPSTNPDPLRKVAVFERRCDGYIA